MRHGVCSINDDRNKPDFNINTPLLKTVCSESMQRVYDLFTKQQVI